MTTTLTAKPPADDLAVFRKQDAIVAELRDKYMGLVIAGVERQKAAEESARLKQLAEDSARRALQLAMAEEARRTKEESLAKLEADLEAIGQWQKEEASRRLKAEAERPQREKLLAVASLVDAIEIPDGAGSDGVANVLLTASQKIRAIANGPLE